MTGRGSQERPAQDVADAAAEEVVGLFDVAVDVFWDALDERDRLTPRDCVDELRWRWISDECLAEIRDQIQESLDALTAKVSKVSKVDSLKVLRGNAASSRSAALTAGTANAETRR